MTAPAQSACCRVISALSSWVPSPDSPFIGDQCSGGLGPQGLVVRGRTVAPAGGRHEVAVRPVLQPGADAFGGRAQVLGGNGGAHHLGQCLPEQFHRDAVGLLPLSQELVRVELEEVVVALHLARREPCDVVVLVAHDTTVLAFAERDRRLRNLRAVGAPA